jgi:hypothetical protein
MTEISIGKRKLSNSEEKQRMESFWESYVNDNEEAISGLALADDHVPILEGLGLECVGNGQPLVFLERRWMIESVAQSIEQISIKSIENRANSGRLTENRHLLEEALVELSLPHGGGHQDAAVGYPVDRPQLHVACGLCDTG